ncbi:hypothetical protein N9980_00440 [bacterium]|nr:hypothetical protein [bacterium]
MRLVISTCWSLGLGFVLATTSGAIAYDAPELHGSGSKSETCSSVVSSGTFEGRAYELRKCDDPLTWFQSRDECQVFGGHLVTIHSLEEQIFLMELIDAGTCEGWGPWIGLTDEDVEGDWIWVSGEPTTFTLWQPGEPNGGTSENYAHIDCENNMPLGNWNDVSHDWPWTTFLCEYSVAGQTMVRRPSGRRIPVLAKFEAKLTASDAADDDRFAQLFGCRVVSGDTAVVGAYLDDNTGGIDAGSAYVFSRSGNTWTEVQKLTASDASAGDYFGGYVFVDGDTAIISASGDDHSGYTDSGSVYVFARDGGVWTEQQKFTASDAGDNQSFGWGLAVDGDTLVVGSLAEKVYTFNRVGDLWFENQILTASDDEPGNGFQNVAINAGTLVVGACGAIGGPTEAGAVYVFARSGGVWTEQQKLTASDGSVGDCLGGGVAVVADTIIATAAFNDHSTLDNPGAGYVFTRSGDTWTEVQKLTASDPAEGDLFGYWLAAEGDMAIIGAAESDHSSVQNAGSAYLFSRAGETWLEREEVVAVYPGEGDVFGAGVALSGDTVMVGAIMDDHSNLIDAGSVYVYRILLIFDSFESSDTSGWSNTVP